MERAVDDARVVFALSRYFYATTRSVLNVLPLVELQVLSIQDRESDYQNKKYPKMNGGRHTNAQRAGYEIPYQNKPDKRVRPKTKHVVLRRTDDEIVK